MAKRPTKTRIYTTPAMLQLLHGSEIQARWTLERCGVQPVVVRQLIRDSKKPNFDSGMYKAANQSEPLSSKLWIVAAEMFFQIHRCKQAIKESRLSDAIETAWLLGEARGALFRMAVNYEISRKGALNTAKKKRSKIEEILATAQQIYRQELSANRGGVVKVDYLWSKVMTCMKENKGPTCGRSTFASHWSALQAKLSSK